MPIIFLVRPGRATGSEWVTPGTADVWDFWVRRTCDRDERDGWFQKGSSEGESGSSPMPYESRTSRFRLGRESYDTCQMGKNMLPKVQAVSWEVWF